MINFDIISKYTYYNSEVENIELLNISATKKDANNYILDKNMYICIKNNFLSITKNSDLKYIKNYELNKKTKASIEVGSNLFNTFIHTTIFEYKENTITISAKEYSENMEFLSDVLIIIKIKES